VRKEVIVSKVRIPLSVPNRKVAAKNVAGPSMILNTGLISYVLCIIPCDVFILCAKETSMQ